LSVKALLFEVFAALSRQFLRVMVRIDYAKGMIDSIGVLQVFLLGQ
jgi:hypothetical protein